MFTLKSGRLPSADVKNIIFFVRPRLELMDIIAENIFRLGYNAAVVQGLCIKVDPLVCVFDFQIHRLHIVNHFIKFWLTYLSWFVYL